MEALNSAERDGRYSTLETAPNQLSPALGVPRTASRKPVATSTPKLGSDSTLEPVPDPTLEPVPHVAPTISATVSPGWEDYDLSKPQERPWVTSVSHPTDPHSLTNAISESTNELPGTAIADGKADTSAPTNIDHLAEMNDTSVANMEASDLPVMVKAGNKPAIWVTRKFKLWVLFAIEVVLIVAGTVGGIEGKKTKHTMSGTALIAASYAVATPVIVSNFYNQIFLTGNDSNVHVIGHSTASLSSTGITTTGYWQNLSSNSFSGLPRNVIAADSHVRNTVDIFVLAPDRHIYHNNATFSYSPSSNWNSSWKGWQVLAGSFGSPPAAVSWSEDRVDVFAISYPDSALVQQTWNTTAGKWEENSLFGNWTDDFAPTTMFHGRGKIDVFIVGARKSLYHAYLAPNPPPDGFLTWFPLNSGGWDSRPGGYLTGKPAVVAHPQSSRIDVFARGGDQALWHLVSSDENHWGKWAQVESSPILADVEAVFTSGGPDTYEIFVWRNDFGYTHRRLRKDKWVSSEDLGGQFLGPPKAVVDSVQVVHLYGIDSPSGHLLYAAWISKEQKWSSDSIWMDLGKGP